MSIALQHRVKQLEIRIAALDKFEQLEQRVTDLEEKFSPAKAAPVKDAKAKAQRDK